VNRNDESKTAKDETTVPGDDRRAPYERPQLLKKRSVARVTLFSGGSASGATGVTST
jgi:hypothetical protein